MMNSPATQQQPSPEKIFKTLTAYQQSAALKAGIDLDLFSAIAQGNDTAGAAAKKSTPPNAQVAVRPGGPRALQN